MSQFTDSLHEVFAALGPVQIKRMFGGHGVWHDGLMCALVANDTLYLKSDALSIDHFKALDLPAFTYRRGDQAMEMSYRMAPETVFEDRAEAALWSRRAFEAALRHANAKPARKAGAKAAAKKAAAKSTTREPMKAPKNAPTKAPTKAAQKAVREAAKNTMPGAPASKGASPTPRKPRSKP